MGFDDRGEPLTAKRPRGRIANRRQAPTVVPDLAALTVLGLASLGAFRIAAISVSGENTELGSALAITSLSVGAAVLYLSGAILLCMSRQLKLAQKILAFAVAVIVPRSFELIRLNLAGYRETCDSGSEGRDGKVLYSYSHCVNGPTWTTHTVEALWAAVPIMIMIYLGMVAVRRMHRDHGASTGADRQNR